MRLIVLGALLLLASCATREGAGRSSEIRREFEDLPAGALVYVRVDVRASQDLLYDILGRNGTKLVKDFLERTDTLAAALYPKNGAGTRGGGFLLAGRGGDYPVFFSSISLAFAPAWKKKKSGPGKTYWRSEKNRLSLLMFRDKTYISDGDPFFDEEGAAAPGDFFAFTGGAPLAAWITNIDPLNAALARMDIPVSIPALSLYIAGFREGDDWQAVFRLETPGPAQARGLVSVLALLRGALAAYYIKDAKAAAFARLLLSEPPALDGSAVILKSPLISGEELAGLTAALSVYLK